MSDIKEKILYKYFGSPNQSFTTIIATVDELIEMAIDIKTNTVHYKIIQAILYILARQMRMLEQMVDLRVEPIKRKPKRKTRVSTSEESDSSERAEKEHERKKLKKHKKRKEKEEEMLAKMSADDKEKYYKQKTDSEKSELETSEYEPESDFPSKKKTKYKEKYETTKKTKSRSDSEPEKSEKPRKKVPRDTETLAEMERIDKITHKKQKHKVISAENLEESDKHREKGGKKQRKDKSQSDKDEGTTDEEDHKQKKEKEKKKGQDKAMIPQMEDKEKKQADAKLSSADEKEKKSHLKKKQKDDKIEDFDKEKKKEEALLMTMDQKDKKEYLKKKKEDKENAKLAKMNEKEREEYKKAKQQEEAKLSSIDEEDRKEYSRKKREEKEITKLAKMTDKEREEYKKEKQREEEKLSLMTQEDRKDYLNKKREEKIREKEDTKLAKMNEKEREEYKKEKQQEEVKLSLMNEEERKIYLEKKKKDDRNAKLKRGDSTSTSSISEESEEEDKSKLSHKEKSQREKGKVETQSKLEKKDGKLQKRGREDDRKEKVEEAKIPKIDKKGTKYETEKYETDSKTRLKEKQRTDKAGTHSGMDLVPLSQLQALEAKVSRLAERTESQPSRPLDQKLMAELITGSATLTDTMESLQVTKRLQATEEAIVQMSGMLTQLAVSGVLPRDVLEQVEEIKSQMGVSDKGISFYLSTARPAGRASTIKGRMTVTQTTMPAPAPSTIRTIRPSSVKRAESDAPRESEKEDKPKVDCVTNEELESALWQLKQDMIAYAHGLTANPCKIAITAYQTLLLKGDVPIDDANIKFRITALHEVIEKSIMGIEASSKELNEQLRCFDGIISEARIWLEFGISLVTAEPNDAEAEAAAELFKEYEKSVGELNAMLYAHRGLCSLQEELSGDLKTILDVLVMLQGEKAYTEEVKQVIALKADYSDLDGMVTSKVLDLWMTDVEFKMEDSFNTFKDKEKGWMNEVKIIKAILKEKSNARELIKEKCSTEEDLRLVQDELRRLALILGDPELTRVMFRMCRNSHCGMCGVPAHQDVRDPSSDQPPELPGLRSIRQPETTSKPNKKLLLPDIFEDRKERYQICERWTGGSHTLVPPRLLRERTHMRPIPLPAPPVLKYLGVGRDRKAYHLEDVLQPCAQCERATGAEVNVDGAGDAGIKKWTLGL